ncbi:conserved hypothetical protein [Vibrio nigripulchritudo SOn1]|uniref:Mu-like prophage FluMu N-terminal domain-containing protein n=1 Tax=Vibrio nigripulchritudo SOn1 TaxID=1238450 RepID=A0AAV2VPL1_9VIBR|nr:hypothetical protein [Vibrio nigripulchritudo]CCO46629.1 conserved hypothetical protein [Vibrio nigripulchritudo SOn1]
MATTKSNTRNRKPPADKKGAESTGDKSTDTEVVVTGGAETTGAGDSTGTENTGDKKNTDGEDSDTDTQPEGNTGAGTEQVEPEEETTLHVLLTNNSVSGHEILRANGSVLAIDGHCKDLPITTDKKELVAIQTALADKPWVEIKLKAE